jgi:hypothetical protein
MTQADVNPPARKNPIGMALAVLLTIAIVVVVFWQQRGPGEGRDGDTRGVPDGRPASGLEEMGDGYWRAYYGPVVVEVTGMPARDFNFRMRPWAMIDEDTRVLVRSQRMLVQDPNAAKAIDLTPEQVEKLKALEPPRMVIDDADREKVIAFWHAWEKADAAHKPAAQDEILNALRDVGQKSIEPTKKAWTDAAAAVKKTLTLQQMAKLAVYQESNPTGWGGPNRFPPATQPR